jgi:glycosyltransferase involved in cell wall biosynthesis
MGGSAQNTFLTCLGLSGKYDLVLVHGLSRESEMTDLENTSVHKQIEKATLRGVKVIPLSSLVRRIDPVQDFQAFLCLFRLIRREKPTIVHTHTSKAGFLGRWAAKLVGVPFIVHTPHGHVFYGHFGAWAVKIFFLIEKITNLITDRIIALTEGERKDYIDFSVSRSEKITTIHSGVEIERYLTSHVNIEEKKISLGLIPKGQVVGTIGWLLPVKGPMLLLKAMESVWQNRSDVELVFVGKGGLKSDLTAQAIEMGVLGRVKFLGWRNDIHEILPVFDLFVLPSLNEGMGRVIVEAMASGKPVVASNVGGIPDLIKDKKNGLLVKPGDEEALANAVLVLLNDPEKARRMGKRGRNRCRDFSLDAMLQKIDMLYQDLLDQAPV